MKKYIFIILTLFLFAFLCELHGYHRGYENGRKSANAWWIDKKSRIYDTSEVLKKDTESGHNHI